MPTRCGDVRRSHEEAGIMRGCRLGGAANRDVVAVGLGLTVYLYVCGYTVLGLDLGGPT